ncbi:uncharacterized protein LOC133814485 [Humulus lupulus]|uniref:uncharacterized protein LOC133814485 n=1 Tax=Humulus lupulus TaxID=3486 RepID=UPI002B403F8D|nr:uncharacterized protein LOC133814485 [Humulus lupulus]
MAGKTGLRGHHDKSHFQTLLNLPSCSDLDPVWNDLTFLLKWSFFLGGFLLLSDLVKKILTFVVLEQVLACLHSMIRKCAYGNFSGDDLLKLVLPDLPVDLQQMLLLLFQKYRSQWKEDVSKEQAPLSLEALSLNQYT